MESGGKVYKRKREIESLASINLRRSRADSVASWPGAVRELSWRACFIILLPTAAAVAARKKNNAKGWWVDFVSTEEKLINGVRLQGKTRLV